MEIGLGLGLEGRVSESPIDRSSIRRSSMRRISVAVDTSFSVSRVIARVWPLSISWALFIAVTTTLDTIGPAAMTSIGGSRAMSTYTFTGYHVGGAIAASCSGSLFNLTGRKKGFIIGASVQCAAGIMAICAMNFKSPGWLLCASILVGFGQGLGNFIRFSAAEIVPLGWGAHGITYVMITGVVAAVMGPLSGTVLQKVLPTRFMGSFIAYLTFAALNVVLLMRTDLTPFKDTAEGKRALALTNAELNAEAEAGAGAEAETGAGKKTGGGEISTAITASDSAPPTKPRPRALLEVLKDNVFIISVSVATIAQVCMMLPMSNLEVGMTQTYFFTFKQASLAMIVHIFVTFICGPAVGHLLSKYHPITVAGIGCLFNILGYVLMLLGHSFFSFIFGMILLGCSWNLGYSAGSVMLLCTCYDDEDQLQKQVQASNDTLLLGITAVMTIFAGILEEKKDGWIAVLYLGGAIVVLQAVIIAAVWQYKDQITPRFRDEDVNDVKPCGEDIVRRQSLTSVALGGANARASHADRVRRSVLDTDRVDTGKVSGGSDSVVGNPIRGAT